MARNNNLTKNDQSNKLQKIPSNIHFDDVSEKSPEQGWQHEGTKYRRKTLAEEQKYNIAAAWQIDSLKRLLAEIEKDPKGVLSMILDIWSIYTKYLKKANKADKKHDEIRTCALGMEQKLYISNEKKEQAVFLL